MMSQSEGNETRESSPGVFETSDFITTMKAAVILVRPTDTKKPESENIENRRAATAQPTRKCRELKAELDRKMADSAQRQREYRAQKAKLKKNETAMTRSPSEILAQRRAAATRRQRKCREKKMRLNGRKKPVAYYHLNPFTPTGYLEKCASASTEDDKLRSFTSKEYIQECLFTSTSYDEECSSTPAEQDNDEKLFKLEDEDPLDIPTNDLDDLIEIEESKPLISEER